MTISDEDKVLLDGHEVERALLADWRIMFTTIEARFRTGDFATGVRLVEAIGKAADELDHHPDVDLRYGHVDVRLSSHDVGGITQRDIRLARTVSELAGRVGATADTASLQVVEFAIDTWDHHEISGFWGAVLGFETDRDHEIVDADGRWSTVWFQHSERHDTPQQRWHVDVRVPPEQAEARIKAAIDAGGTLVSDERAPAFWVLADAQGNQACITTWLGRD
ncbi:MAG: 4a-hydroxytetrahydrobiopterin dehydratase [Actinobacteria bacterium]|uniref:4a-hydroxytetrahydrobiopterin dehydratase n=1 Tax=freshwater metagenome TaxID=449393 RepID=A0A6J6SEN7_9ZZZZ|nr:4a-hydroxytetrahydrobiopterin dehydratase [Actinomycetota bacterium]